MAIGFGLRYFLPEMLEDYNILVIVILAIALVWIYILYKQIKNKPHISFFKKMGDTLAPFIETTEAIGDMPKMMWTLSGVYFFQWYALFCYWQFITPMLRTSLYGIDNSDYKKYEGIMEACEAGEVIGSVDQSFAQNIQILSEQALAQTGLMNGTYNLITMLVALALVPLARRVGSKWVYVLSLVITGFAMLSMPYIKNEYMLLAPMILFGIGWAAMMGIPYSMVSKVIPEDRRGVYMG
ncbi:MAG: MFS transporter, partial [Flavobacteriaceae bacterium]|nr:MFS transporter [Flavobacteriaceae bacterium]